MMTPWGGDRPSGKLELDRLVDGAPLNRRDAALDTEVVLAVSSVGR